MNQDEGLFEDLPGPSAADVQQKQARAGMRSHGAPRILEPNRKQIELRASDLESLLPKTTERDSYGAMSNGKTWARCTRPSRRGARPPDAARSTHASCSHCGCTPRWTGWAVVVKSRD
jgi:hypothetical protein